MTEHVRRAYIRAARHQCARQIGLQIKSGRIKDLEIKQKAKITGTKVGERGQMGKKI